MPVTPRRKGGCQAHFEKDLILVPHSSQDTSRSLHQTLNDEVNARGSLEPSPPPASPSESKFIYNQINSFKIK